jgi:hypothetical protein
LALVGCFSTSTIASHRCTLGHCGATASMSGRKVASKATTRSSAWLTIQAIWSGCRRGLMVWNTPPIPPTP